MAGFDDVRINIATGVYGTTRATTPLAGSAATEATNVVGPASPGIRLPAAPPASLIAQLSGLPATWSTAGSQLKAELLASAAFSTTMAAGLKSTAAAAALVATPQQRYPDTRHPPKWLQQARSIGARSHW